MARPTPGNYIVKLQIKKDGSWDAEVVGRWAPLNIGGHKGEDLVEASKTTKDAVRSWARLRLQS